MQPQVVQTINQEAARIMWQTRMCSCCEDIGSCCEAVWCFPCQIGHQCAALSNNFDSCSCSCFTACFLVSFFGVECCYILSIRNSLVNRFHIDEHCCLSCLCATYCPMCSLCQTHREMRIRGIPVRGFCVNCIGSAYPVGTMTGPSGISTSIQQQQGGDQLNKGSHLAVYGYLTPGEFLQHGSYAFVHQQDGNVVLYDTQRGNQPLWATGTMGNATKYLILQVDGNLVLYATDGRPLWASHTAGQMVNVVVLTDGGVLELRAGDASVWACHP